MEILFFGLAFMVAMTYPKIRRTKFELFYYTHHFALAMLSMAVIHR